MLIMEFVKQYEQCVIMRVVFFSLAYLIFLKGILIEVYEIIWYNFHSQLGAEGVGYAAERN